MNQLSEKLKKYVKFLKFLADFKNSNIEKAQTMIELYTDQNRYLAILNDNIAVEAQKALANSVLFNWLVATSPLDYSKPPDIKFYQTDPPKTQNPFIEAQIQQLTHYGITPSFPMSVSFMGPTKDMINAIENETLFDIIEHAVEHGIDPDKPIVCIISIDQTDFDSEI